MFVILYYDVNAKRCSKMLKTCRRYLIHVQNSVFEGEINDAAYEKMIYQLKEIMKDKDSLVVYCFKSMMYSKRNVYGNDKKKDTTFI